MNYENYGRSPANFVFQGMPLSDMLRRGGIVFDEAKCECSKPKPTENDKTKKALKEINHATEKAKAILTAADAMANKRINEVEVNGNSLYISFSKVDEQADEKSVKEVSDVDTHLAMNATRQNVATELANTLQRAGRTMLTLTAMASSKLVTPELMQIAKAQQEAQAKQKALTEGSNQGGNASNEKVASLQVKENIAKAAHASDCATNNGPAMKPGPCDCK